MVVPSEKSIFLDALEFHSEQERAAFLDEACAGNPALRAAVANLLRIHDQPNNLLDSIPAVVSVLPQGLGSDVAANEVPEGSDRPGTSIGPYRLMEQIGEGGFGLVFVAEQKEPVRRRVALKIVKPGMDTREVIARFEQERQALALMDHPNIAHVFDAGETLSGRPYFVMELVRGISITEFCDRNRSTIPERLHLFSDVCRAVHHAHQKGVIHRDLKPSNVLVTLHDGRPVVKVIDFGVAKAVGPRLTDRTIYTRFTQMIGTPLYMSPEQAEMSGLDVDTRSDIYSLGVLLYELLTGVTPFDRERMRTASFDDVRRIIRDEEPPRPSARLTTLGACSVTVSDHRQAEPKKLMSIVRGDLDWIVMNALEKDRSRRYESAAAMAADVRRFLDDEVIEARPPSTLYRFRKIARRYRVALSTALVVVATLVVGISISLWQAVRASKAEAEAVTARRQTEQFVERLNAANLLLESARSHAEEGRWAEAHADYTHAIKVLPEHSMVWSGRGSLYLKLGLWNAAAQDYTKALDLGAAPRGPSWWGIPQLLAYTGDEARYRDVCAEMLQRFDESPDPTFARMVVRSCVVTPKPVFNPTTLADRAEQSLADSPDRLSPPSTVAIWYYIAGVANYRAGRNDRAIELLNTSFNSDPRWPLRVINYPVLAMAYHRTGRADAARDALQAADGVVDQCINRMMASRVGTMPIPWHDWVEYLQLYREAKRLITGENPPDDPQLKVLERRALDVLGLQ